jgi:hypothetical protein
MKPNDILREYIKEKYGSEYKFLKKEKFPPQDLELILDKKDIFYEIGIGIRVCDFLNIDAFKLFCRNEAAIKENSGKKDAGQNLSLDDRIKEKYAELSKDKQKKARDYADYIFENGDV